MKCIQYVHTNEIARVTDEDAYRLTARSLARYVLKSKWKKASRPEKTDAAA